MKNKIFFDRHQAEMYLTHSVIRVGPDPVFILDIGRRGENGELVMYYKVLGGRGREEIRVDNPLVDMNPVPLGFVTIKQYTNPTIFKVLYATRVPTRHFKIGLARRNLVIQQLPFDVRVGIQIDHLLTSTALKKTILGQYKPYKEVYEYLEKRKYDSTLAISRRWAIQKADSHINLVYANAIEPVGVCTEEGPQLFDSYQFLQQRLEKEVL